MPDVRQAARGDPRTARQETFTLLGGRYPRPPRTAWLKRRTAVALSPARQGRRRRCPYSGVGLVCNYANYCMLGNHSTDLPERSSSNCAASSSLRSCHTILASSGGRGHALTTLRTLEKEVPWCDLGRASRQACRKPSQRAEKPSRHCPYRVDSRSLFHSSWRGPSNSLPQPPNLSLHHTGIGCVS